MLLIESPITYFVTCSPNINFIDVEFDLDAEIMALLSIVTEVRPLQLLKAWSPMLITLSGMVMEVRLLQLSKADLPILVTLSGIVTEVIPGLHLIRVPFVINNPSLVSSSHKVAPQLLRFVNEELLTNESVVKKQPWNADNPMLVTLSGIVINLKSVQ